MSDELLARLAFEATTLRMAIDGDDDTGVLAEWFRPGFLREIASDIEQSVAALRERDRRIAELERVEDMFAVAVRCVSLFVECNDSPCRRDYHGICQSHYAEHDCTVARARQLLNESRATVSPPEPKETP